MPRPARSSCCRSTCASAGRTPGIVFALNNDVVMMNDYARTVLAPADQDALLRLAAEALAAGRPTRWWSSSPRARASRCTPARSARGSSAAASCTPSVADVSAPRSPDSGSAARMLLPGLVGSGALWRRACDEVESVYRSGEWLALEGEPGVGKAGHAAGHAPAPERRAAGSPCSTRRTRRSGLAGRVPAARCWTRAVATASAR